MRIAAIVAIFAVLAAGAFILFRFASFSQAAAVQQQRMDSAFISNPNNGVSVTIAGWRRFELDKILDDFRQMYELPATFDSVISAESTDTFLIRFPNDIQPKFLYFLINYLRYPRGFDLKSRRIVVAGHVLLSSAFGIPNSVLSGKRAIIYIPQNDTDYDFVCIQVDAGESYKVSFTDLVWVPVTHMPVPAGVDGF